MLYDLAMQVSMIDRSVYSNSLHLLAMGMALDIKPEKMAEMLTNETEKMQEYGKQINEAIDAIRKKDEAAKAEKPAEEIPAQDK